VLVFFGALLDAPGGTARAALIPELAEMASMPLERATSANQVIERSSRLIGAPLAGLLIAALGTANVLWFDAISFFISAGIVTSLVAAPVIKAKIAKRGKYFQEILDGFRFIRKDALILAIVIIVMTTNFLDAAFSGVILPVYVNTRFGEALQLGLIIAASAGGSVLGAVIFGAIGHRLPRYATFGFMFVITSIRTWIFALYPPLAILLLANFILSLGSGPLNPILDAVAYERMPKDMRGRIYGTITAGAWIAMPLGVLLGGFLTEAYGVQPLLIAIGAIYLGTTLSIAFIPAMKQMERSSKKIRP